MFGEQVYWAINRSMDMVVGTEYYSKRGWAPNGDFRYKGPGLDHLTVRWNALLDRGVEQAGAATATAACHNRCWSTRAALTLRATGPQGSHPRHAPRRQRRISLQLRLPPGLQRQLPQAISSEVPSTFRSPTTHNGFVPSVSLDRFQTFASSTNGDEASILHLPSLRLRRARPPARRFAALLGAGFVARLPEPLRARLSRAQRRAASTSIRISRCPSPAAAGASFPRSRCATPSTPTARHPT